MRNFRELDIWQKSRKLVKEIYQVTRNFPAEERYGLSSQIQRAGVSIPSNIAEGCSRKSEIEFTRFLEIAQGSAFEVETQLILANDLGYLQDDLLNELIIDIHFLQRQINKLITVIRKN
ncbi:four helix bundle protein [Membranicola marinus]|uniref:Four helix bundle protein n=1 Tax=Membranihabitans marinus TaxID=1227546 RepID=A0A953HIV3_9BACT|nr:four helix bundle protein [Membranihabitans marinus]MBY5956664.1 four helix bundle protein [Membranihabitans marinus]